MLKPWDEIQPAADKGYVHMLQMLVPVGLRGLFLAALFGAIQSTINSVLNSSATIVTLDIYKRMIRKNATDRNLVVVGIWSSIIILISAIVMALFIGKMGKSLFVYIQSLYAFFAPPFSAVFLLGILFKRINAKGATFAVFVGFAFGILMKMYLAFWPDMFGPDILHFVQPFSNQSLLHWIFCVIICLLISLFTEPPSPEQITDQLTINWRKLNIFSELGDKWYKSVILWWGLFAAIIVSLVIVFSKNYL
jgi:SSS family solute:Na+ symporter